MYRSALRSQPWSTTSGYVCRHCRHHLFRQQTASQTRHESTQAQAVADRGGHGAGDEEFINSFNSLSEEYSTKPRDKTPARAGFSKPKKQSQAESVKRHTDRPPAHDRTVEGVVRRVLDKPIVTEEQHGQVATPRTVETAFQRGTSTKGLETRTVTQKRHAASTLGGRPEINTGTDSEAVRKERAEFESMLAGLIPEASPQQPSELESLIDRLHAKHEKPTPVDEVSVAVGILANQVNDEGTVQAEAQRHVGEPDASLSEGNRASTSADAVPEPNVTALGAPGNTPDTTASNRRYAFGAPGHTQPSAAAKQRELNSRPGWGDSPSIPAKANKASFDTLREADKVSATPVIRTAGEVTAWGTELVNRGKPAIVHRTIPPKENPHHRQVRASRDAAGAVAEAGNGLGQVLDTMAVSPGRTVAGADKETDMVKHRDPTGLGPLDLLLLNEELKSRELDSEVKAPLRDVGECSDRNASSGPVPNMRTVTLKDCSPAATKIQALVGKARARRLERIADAASKRVGAVPGMAGTSTASGKTVDVNGAGTPRLTRRNRVIIRKHVSNSLEKHAHNNTVRRAVENRLASREGSGALPKGSTNGAEGRSTSGNDAEEGLAKLHVSAEGRPAQTDEQRSLADVMAGLSKTPEAALPHEIPLAAPEPYETPAESWDIRSISARELKVTALNVQGQPLVPSLQYGLDRVLFNAGVYQMQDPLSCTYNFDPYLQKIMPIAEFDFNALKEYKTSSADTFLGTIANEHGKKYIGSTSSMTGTLAHFHYLLSNWRPINLDMLSRGFKEQVDSFTQINRAPNSIFLRYKSDTGTYAIDVDKEYDGANVLMMLGKSMEKLLTLPKEQYERYRRNNTTNPITATEKEEPEAFEYTTMGDFLMRSQLDAHDARLPGTGMFDLKTRAVLPIRMDTEGYVEMLGYEIFTLQGSWESFEREYYDMLRSTMLKYMLQARMGRMEGIFLAYHNVERVFGFQYMPMMEIDRAMHGQVDPCLGDQEFRLSLKVLNEALEMATAEFPGRSLRVHFETAASPAGVMWIFAEPMEEEEIDEVQGRSKSAVEEFEAAVMGIEKKPKVVEEASEVAEEALGDEEAMVRAAEQSVGETSTIPMHSHEDSVPQSTDGATTAPESKAEDTYSEEAYATTTTPADPVFIGQVSSAVEDNLKPLFAATLILQNIVNGKPCEHNRPRDLKRTDEWELQYILKQTPLGLAEKWARYQGVKARKRSVFSKVGRAEALDGAVDGSGKGERVEPKEMETGYRRMLKEMVARGRRFRKAIDRVEERMGSGVKRVDMAAPAPEVESSSIPGVVQTETGVREESELRGDLGPSVEAEKFSTTEADDITAASEPAAARPDSATKMQSPSMPGVEEMGNDAHENGELPGDSRPVVDAEKASTTEDDDATVASGQAAAAAAPDSVEEKKGNGAGYLSWLYRKM
ncbi:hypothetical protein LTS09_013369 [Friedmanniomyces endolithicus]|nr:hypothetical protein LTS09_013369 [Friedmanniomyces endolithicus]